MRTLHPRTIAGIDRTVRSLLDGIGNVYRKTRSQGDLGTVKGWTARYTGVPLRVDPYKADEGQTPAIQSKTEMVVITLPGKVSGVWTDIDAGDKIDVQNNLAPPAMGVPIGPDGQPVNPPQPADAPTYDTWYVLHTSAKRTATELDVQVVCSREAP